MEKNESNRSGQPFAPKVLSKGGKLLRSSKGFGVHKKETYTVPIHLQHTMSTSLLRRRSLISISALLSLVLLDSAPAAFLQLRSSQPPAVNSVLGSQTAGEASQTPAIRDLRQDQPIKQELTGKEPHLYRITLKEGQYTRVVVEPKGCDVAIRLFGTHGQKVVEVDSNLASEPESISVLAETPGEYRLEVGSKGKQEATGSYEIRIDEWRPATSRDRDRFAAQTISWEADQLLADGKAESSRKSIEKYQEALSLWHAAEDTANEAHTLNQLGVLYSGVGENQKALQYYNQALPLFRDLKDRRRESIVLNNTGGVYFKMGEPRKALDYVRRALELKKAIGDRRGEANSLHSIGSAYSQLGELQLALEYYDQALPLTRLTGQRLGESLTLSSIGSVYFKMGEWQKSLEFHTLGLNLARELGNKKSEAAMLHNVGTVLFQLGETRKALEHYAEALGLRRAVGDRHGEAYTLDSMGSAYLAMGERQKALDYHNQALSLNRAVGDKYAEAYALSNVGIVQARLGAVREALETFNQALQVNKLVGDRRGQAFLLRNIGSAYSNLKESATATENLNNALEIYRAISDRNSQAGVLLDLARVERDQKHLNEARALVESSLAIIESERRTVNSEDLRASYMTTKRGFYEFYIDLLMQLHKEHPAAGYDAVAMHAGERARARSLLDILAEAGSDIREGVEPKLLEQERNLQKQLSIKSEQLTRLLSGKRTEDQQSATRKEVDSLLESYQEVEGKIRARSPRYAALTQPEPLSLKQIQQQVLDKDTLLLQYSLGEDRSYLWAVTPGSINSYVLPGRATVEAAALRVNELLVAKAEGLYPAAVTTLSQMLLNPVIDQLEKKRLVIVGDGALQYLPFGALPVPSGKLTLPPGRRGMPAKHGRISFEPLILNHEIVSLPSASVLAILRRDLGQRETAPKALAVLADPVFEKQDERVRPVIKKQGEVQNGIQKEIVKTALPADVERSTRESGLSSFERLALSRLEAELITTLASRGQPLKALDFTASRATATSRELAQYRIVHFATHSLMNNQHPELSGIVLSLVDEQGQPQDGFLRLYEIYNLKLAADLVVLSACQTALGREIKGEGLVGLTRGFMYAGAPRVVASLWKVGDKATAELMKRFYQKMFTDGLRPAAALRAAQVSMLKERQWQAAYYWAGFVLQGEWR